MYPDLSYFLHDLFGTDPDNWFSIINTFGFFLVLAFLASAYFLRKELLRKEAEGLLLPKEETITSGQAASVTDLISNALGGFIFGFKVPYILQNLSAFKSDAASIVFSTEGNLLLGILGAIGLAGWKYWDSNKTKLAKPKVEIIKVMPSDRIADITMVAAISGILGAKLFAFFESKETFDALLEDPIGQIFSGSGLAIYGGLIVAFIVVYYYVYKKGIKPIHVMDAVAPALIMGYAVGRLGCQFSGDGDWGIPNANPTPDWWFLPDWMWSYGYPRNVSNEGIRMEDCPWEHCSEMIPGVYPTPLYEVVMSLIIFSILWSLRKRLKIPGMLFFIYMILNGVERFWIEKIRVNYKLPWADITQAELIAMLLMIGGVIGIIVVWMRSKSKTVAT